MTYGQQLRERVQAIVREAVDAECRQIRGKATGPGAQSVDWENLHEELQTKYQNWTQPFFEPFTEMPDPASYDGAIEELSAAMGCLAVKAYFNPITKEGIPENTDLEVIETAIDDIGGWQGKAADTFRDNVLDKLDGVVDNQFLILAIMRAAVQADQEVWKRARRDINKIADDTLNALDNVPACGKSDIKFALSVVGAVASVVGIAFTSGAAAAVAGASAMSTVGSAVVDDLEKRSDDKMVEIGGPTVSHIVTSMGSAIDDLTHQISVEQGEIVKTLNKCTSDVDQQKQSYVSPRPKLASMEESKLTSGRGLGDHE